MENFDWKKYVYVLVITLLIFFTVLYLGNAISNRKLDSLKIIQDQLATDILSSETRFSLLERTSCDYVTEDALLSEELYLFGSRLAIMERQLGAGDERVKQLKRYYSVIQIKDYLLMSDLAKKCGINRDLVLYFYEDDCVDCRRQGYVLSELQREHPDFRVYSFDYNIESSAVRTLNSIYGVGEKLPSLVINEKVYNGFHTTEELEALLPNLSVDEDEEDLETNQETVTDEDKV